MLGRLASIPIIMLFPSPADAPVPDWVLVPGEFVEVNLCLKECPLKARWVTKYEWRTK